MRPTAADAAAARAALRRCSVLCREPGEQHLTIQVALVPSNLDDATALVRELDASAATPMVQSLLLEAVAELLRWDSPTLNEASNKLRLVLQRAGFAQAALRALATHVTHAHLALGAFKALFYLKVWELAADVEEAVVRETLAWASRRGGAE